MPVFCMNSIGRTRSARASRASTATADELVALEDSVGAARFAAASGGQLRWTDTLFRSQRRQSGAEGGSSGESRRAVVDVVHACSFRKRRRADLTGHDSESGEALLPNGHRRAQEPASRHLSGR